MISITRRIAIDERELKFQYMRASGPGGQHVNKVASAVQLRFDAVRSATLPGWVGTQLRRLPDKRVSRDGMVMIEANRYRSQARNRQEAIDRLVALLARAAAPAKRRIPTRPSRQTRQRRLDAKRQQGVRKRLRGPPRMDS